jgi:hypothetical protein
VLALVEGLPADSAFAAAAAAARTKSAVADWRTWQSGIQTALLLAELIDRQRENTRIHVGPRYKLKPHERPGDRKTPTVVRVADITEEITG